MYDGAMRERRIDRGRPLALGALAAVLSACLGDDDGRAGGTGASCDDRPSCSDYDDCPPLSCLCPGARFPAEVRACRGGCCPATCAEACGDSGDPCATMSCGDHSTCVAPDGGTP